MCAYVHFTAVDERIDERIEDRIIVIIERGADWVRNCKTNSFFWGCIFVRYMDYGFIRHIPIYIRKDGSWPRRDKSKSEIFVN